MCKRSQIAEIVKIERDKQFSSWKQWRIKCQVCKKRLKEWKGPGYIDEFEKEYICGECWIKENERSKQKDETDKIESGRKIELNDKELELLKALVSYAVILDEDIDPKLKRDIEEFQDNFWKKIMKL